jgi:hypothetical protein
MARLLVLLLLWSWPAAAETLRVATYNAALSRDAPGLLLRDILKGDARSRRPPRWCGRRRRTCC